MTDEQLVAKVVAGDVESFRNLIEKYQMPLTRYAIYLIHDPDVAEDIVQDSFIKAYQNLRGFRSGSKFSSWIYRIVHNTAMDAVRHHELDSRDISDLEILTSNEPTIEEVIDSEIAAAKTHKCLDKLSVKYREVIVLSYMQNRSYQEISDILHISVSSVGVHINRAKRKLREICKQMGVKR